MDLPQGRLKRKEFWLSHLNQAQSFSGTDTEYCRQHNLNIKTFGQYKIKYGFTKSKKTGSGGFAKVKVDTPIFLSKIDYPDAKWLADFLKAWSSSN